MIQRIDMTQNRHTFFLESSIFLHFICLQGEKKNNCDFIGSLSSLRISNTGVSGAGQ